MSDMKVSNLNVDLIQDQATIGFYKQSDPISGRSRHTAVTINVPITTAGDQPESGLRKAAIDEARKALQEALRTLELNAA